ncbi:MAG TPA: GspE/PulE family protein [Ramlibacter sp.]|nr:GspE/PulE family protein [Ramlibacter sp.]
MSQKDFEMTRSFMVDAVPQSDFGILEPDPSDAHAAMANARRLGLPYFDLKSHELHPQTIKLIGETQARRFKALVLDDRGDTYLVGFVDPWDLRAQDEVASILKRPIDVAVINAEQHLDTIEKVYRKTEQIGHFAKQVGQQVKDTVVDLSALGSSLEDADAPVVKLLQTIFDDAARVNASDIHFEPQEESLVVRFRMDGILHVQVKADPSIAATLIVRLKLMAGLDIAERRLPQDGRLNVKSGDSRFDVRISTMPTQFGESVVLRLLRQDSVRLKLPQIMPARARTIFEKALASPHGIVLVTGPTGSGKTTTLYAALEQLNSPEVKILTAEDPVEYRLPGVNQVQVNEKIELSFARVLRSFLRQDPDILLVGEIRDNETADIACRAALTGHLVLSTLHTNDAPSTPLRLLDMKVPGYLIASSLLAVVSQRLVRLLCPKCSVPASPSSDHLDWFRTRVSAEEFSLAKFRHGKGCVRCNDVGFFGRRGVFEIVEMTPELGIAIQHDDPGKFERLAREQIGKHTIERNAYELVLAGETTIAEAMTVAVGD